NNIHMLSLTCSLFTTENSLEYQLCTDDRRADCLKTEFMIRALADRVIDTANNLLDVEELFGNLARHNIAVIAIRDGSECISISNTCAAEHILIDTVAYNRLTLKIGTEPPEGITAIIDN